MTDKIAEIIETLRECAEMVAGGRQNGLTEFWHDETAKVTAEVCAAAADALDAANSRIAELERTLLLTPMAERVAELPDFMAALSEWGCVDPNEQAGEITKFLNSTVGLREYLEDQSNAGGRDGH